MDGFNSFFDNVEVKGSLEGVEVLGLERNHDYSDESLVLGVYTHDGRYNWRKVERTTNEYVIDSLGVHFRPDDIHRVRLTISGNPIILSGPLYKR